MGQETDIKVSKNLFFFFFFLSGFSGLIYESIWTHYLKLFLGHAAYSQILVLTIFMGGMAIGSWLAARYTDRLKKLVVMYAIVEGIIGILALLFHTVFIVTTDFAFTSILPSLDAIWSVQAVKWTLAAVLILPQSILLGSTFPLMSGGVIRRFDDSSGQIIASLYFSNSLGAAIGILVSGFLLIPMVGLPGTILAAGLLNIFLALIIWLLTHRENEPFDNISTRNALRSLSPEIRKRMIIFLLCAFFTGMASFLYEIAWIRMLNQVLGTSIQAFELMLSAFILGLAIGGYWIRKRIQLYSDIAKVLGMVQILMGTLALMTIVSYSYTFAFMKYLLHALQRTEPGYLLYTVFSHIIAMGVMLPVTICAGMTLPLITYYLLKEGAGEASIGRVYAANTVGAIVGVVFAVMFIMPHWGVKNVVVVGALIDILLGAFLLLFFCARSSFFNKAAILSSCILFAVIWTTVEFDPILMSSGVYRHGKIVKQNKTSLFHKDGKTSSVDLYQLDNIVSISTNGKPDASISLTSTPTADEVTMILTGALPLLTHENLKTAAVIGIGAGFTTHTLLTDDKIERVDTVEIEPAMVEGSRLIGEAVQYAHTDPRSQIVIEDAKTYFSNKGEKYDVIISEPSNPWVSGVSGLFSIEFYSLVKNYINSDGYLVQWIHLYELDMKLVSTIIKALSPVFNDYIIYSVNKSDLIIIASPNGNVPGLNNRFLEKPGLKSQLTRIKMDNYQALLQLKVGSKKLLDPLFYSYPLVANSDYFPILEYSAPKDRFLKKNAMALDEIKDFYMPLEEILAGTAGAITDRKIVINENDSKFAKGIEEATVILNALRNQEERMAADTADTKLFDKDICIIKKLGSYGRILNKKTFHQDFLVSIQAIAGKTIPYLSAEDAIDIWDSILTTPEFEIMPKRIQKWVHLYKAISARDYDGILEVSLPQKSVRIEATPSNDFLLAVSMLSYIAKGEKSFAVDLWKRYDDSVDLPIWLRLIMAHAFQP